MCGFSVPPDGRPASHADQLGPLPRKHGLRVAAPLRDSGTAGRVLMCASGGYAIVPQLLSRSGDLRGGRWTGDGRTLWICYVGQCEVLPWTPSELTTSSHTSPTHLTELGSRVSAGFFSQPAGVASAARSGCLMGHGVKLRKGVAFFLL